ncbi:hypothetical protein [Bradyrhizobium sp. dw_78]|uniref:hypothetical protein n=1 Tax=Bradyrhizobium sp. dw_78 TaxID=2719793 RepID=UPI001BD5DFB4|nr:hypothetical protein [Bradyrhizobium sp. dw_78]
MKRLSLSIAVAVWMLVSGAAFGQQMIPPGWSRFSPPPPAPPPSPRIEVPAIPHFDAPPRQPQIRSSRRGSFSDRISRCLDDAAAAGLGPNARTAYSRACANR